MQELTLLQELSSRIGHELNLVQAGGGNTSLKYDGILWVKASGKWLIHALSEDMFLPVPMTDILRCLDGDHEYVEEYVTPSGATLRPSVETAMHAVLPHRVVVHVHSVNTIAWAVRTDAPDVITSRLSGVRWTWIPYVHPGLVLGQQIRKTLSSKPDVLILGNHGLVVGAEDCASAEKLLHDIENRLKNNIRSAPQADVDALRDLATPGWRVAASGEVHALATDSFSLEVAAGGILYPNECVYLGPALAVAGRRISVAQAIDRHVSRYSQPPKIILVAGKGVLVPDNLDQAAQELLISLKRILERLNPTVGVRYLEDEQVSKLLNWDAEKYRIAQARQYDTFGRVPPGTGRGPVLQ